MGKKEKPSVRFFLADPNSTPAEELDKVEKSVGSSHTPLMKSILNVLNGGRKDSIERLAFEVDPAQHNQYSAVYKGKQRLIPDSILKRIAIQDDLVAAILNGRGNQISTFGRPQKDRFSIGFKFELKPEIEADLKEDQKKKIQDRIRACSDKLNCCGAARGWSTDDKMTFSQYLFITTRNALTVGRIATEAVYIMDPASGQKKFHSFRPIDAGTIYRATPQKEAQQEIRQEALRTLETIKNKDFEPERWSNDEYAWVQVIEGRPYQVFTADECLVHNLYPMADVELDGYPLTPIDSAISAITTHINITTHNKLYFQNGRAARGMIVIKSEDIDDEMLNSIRHHFQANVNNVANSWRVPVMGTAKDEDIQWVTFDSGTRDMEFQYLSDNNARVILSAFQMSPEEIPGYAHLSRGTSNQALSESNREYILEAHRDLGIRPLLASIEDFVNSRIMPLLDPELHEIATLRLSGLEAETPEKESVRLQQDAPVHMTMDQILHKVEKQPVGKEWGGDFLFNPQYQAILDKYFKVGEILEFFFNKKGAAQDPNYQYIRDPFYFQWVQLQAQMQQAQQQAQMQQQQAQQQGQPQQGDDQQQGQGGDLSRSIDQASQALGKSEAQLPPSKRRLLVQQKKLVENTMKDFEADSQDMISHILSVAKKFTTN